MDGGWSRNAAPVAARVRVMHVRSYGTGGTGVCTWQKMRESHPLVGIRIFWIITCTVGTNLLSAASPDASSGFRRTRIREQLSPAWGSFSRKRANAMPPLLESVLRGSRTRYWYGRLRCTTSRLVGSLLDLSFIIHFHSQDLHHHRSQQSLHHGGGSFGTQWSIDRGLVQAVDSLSRSKLLSPRKLYGGRTLTTFDTARHSGNGCNVG
jgi:hypothetical protein